MIRPIPRSPVPPAGRRVAPGWRPVRLAPRRWVAPGWRLVLLGVAAALVGALVAVVAPTPGPGTAGPGTTVTLPPVTGPATPVTRLLAARLLAARPGTTVTRPLAAGPALRPAAGALQCSGAAGGPPVGERSRSGCGVPAVVHRGVGREATREAAGARTRAGTGRGTGVGAARGTREVARGVTERGRSPEAAIVWRRSRALGRPNRGRLVAGIQLPAVGTHFVTVDPVTRTSPNRAWRRHGTDRLIEVLLRVAQDHAAAHPDAPRLVVGDLSRPRGGEFGRRYGGDGHRSHQNGLDADIYYPRRDGRERIPTRVAQIDRRLAQELVDRFVLAGAQYVFVGPRTGLRGPSKVVMALGNHDDHLHLRIRPGPRAGR